MILSPFYNTKGDFMPVSKPIPRDTVNKIIEEFESSGKSRRVFCEERGLKLGTFHWWMKRYKAECNKESVTMPFIKVKSAQLTKPQLAEQPELTLNFSSGTRLNWRGSTLPSSLLELVQLLEKGAVL
jgi:hypothetical protein